MKHTYTIYSEYRHTDDTVYPVYVEVTTEGDRLDAFNKLLDACHNAYRKTAKAARLAYTYTEYLIDNEVWFSRGFNLETLETIKFIG